MIWVMLNMVAQNIPKGGDAVQIQRKLIKIIAGVIYEIYCEL